MKEMGHLKDFGADERMILKWDIKGTGWQGVNWINLAQSWVHMANFCGHDDEPSGSIQSGEFLEYLSENELLKQDPAAWS